MDNVNQKPGISVKKGTRIGSTKQVRRLGSLIMFVIVVAAATRSKPPAGGGLIQHMHLQHQHHQLHDYQILIPSDELVEKEYYGDYGGPDSKHVTEERVIQVQVQAQAQAQGEGRNNRRGSRQEKDKDKDPYIQPESKTALASSEPSKSKKLKLKVPYPVFVLNLPKSGTTTLWQYFECGLGPDRAIHWWTNDNKRIGPCVHHNIALHQPPLHRCGNYDVWVDFGYTSPSRCFFPAVQGLEPLYNSYPHATFLWIPRDTVAWYRSASKWGPMLHKWATVCRADFFPNHTSNHHSNNNHHNDAPLGSLDFQQFYRGTHARIRQFAQDHPTMNYVEPPGNMTLSSPDLGAWLEETIGIPASCWGKCQPKGHTVNCESTNE
jgi:Sulfotransferase domain